MGVPERDVAREADLLERRDGVSFTRLLWVAPLTVIVAIAVNLVIKAIVVALDPSLADMGQLGRPLVILTLQGAVLAVVVFVLMVWLVPHPIRWYRIVAVIALLVSLIPDLLLGMGGDARRTGSALVGPFLRLGAMLFPSGPPPARSGGGPPAGPPPALPAEQVLVLMLLHVATAVVCIVVLTTLTRVPPASGVTRRQAG